MIFFTVKDGIIYDTAKLVNRYLKKIKKSSSSAFASSGSWKRRLEAKAELLQNKKSPHKWEGPAVTIELLPAEYEK